MNNDLILYKKVPLSTPDANLLCVELNRPASLNALNLEMVSTLYQILHDAESNDQIKAVFLSGIGPHSFCAGGDIKEMYHSAHESGDEQYKTADDFFKAEYHLDYMLHNYKKDLIVYGHGIVMGGGMGLLQSAKIKIITPTTQIAMPEIAIGLFPDVGAHYFLNQIPKPWGRFMALTGAKINAREALELNLADIISSLSSQDVLDILIKHYANHNSLEVNDLSLYFTEYFDLFSRLSSEYNTVDALFNEIHNLDEIIRLSKHYLHDTHQDLWVSNALNAMLNGSYQSVLVTNKAFNYTQSLSLKETFQLDYILAQNMIRTDDFIEGVRAQVIDKDKTPRWTYSLERPLNCETLTQLFTPHCANNLLFDT
jgi:enoyl-CoA hydratase/carnithine racemase